MTTIQLRRYALIPEERDAFITWWQKEIPLVRRAHGFEILFAYLVPETDEFVWAVSHEGDAEEFARAEAEYEHAPDRLAAFEGVPKRTREMRVNLVQQVGT
jgi:hypothetical protein